MVESCGSDFRSSDFDSRKDAKCAKNKRERNRKTRALCHEGVYICLKSFPFQGIKKPVPGVASLAFRTI